MKKLLISLIIIMNLIFIPVFADDNTPVTVSDTADSALSRTSGALYGFSESFDRCYDYIVTNNYIANNQKYILFPTGVVYTSTVNGVQIEYILMLSSSVDNDDKFVIISHNSIYPSYAQGSEDFWVGYTGDFNDITAYRFTEVYNYSNLSVLDSFSTPVNVSSTTFTNWGCRWKTNFNFNNNVYLLVSTYKNIAQFGGLYYSFYSSQDLLPTYYGYYISGFNSGDWNDHYTINPNYVINNFRYDYSNIVNVNTEVYTTSNSIIFDNNGTNTEIVDYNVDAIWGTLKGNIFNLLGGLANVLMLFTVIFSWLPIEYTSLIYSALILAITLLIIKVLRGG